MRGNGNRTKHPGGGLFALCDGNVRFVGETIDFSNGGVTVNNYPALNIGGLGAYQLLGIHNDGSASRAY